jgi:hypothetical protein
MGLLDRFKKKTDDAAEEVKQAADVPTAPAVPADDGAVGVATERAGDAAPAEAETVASGEYRTVHINPGKRGWGSGFDVEFKPG